MEKFIFVALMISTIINNSGAQTPYYDVTAGTGNGVRFWQSDGYKIHMGIGAEYQYGPVTDYSIKSNMDLSAPNRGWTWGVGGQVPVAALNTTGNMQIAGGFTASSFSVGMALNSRKFALWNDPTNWYGLGIQGGQLRMQVGTGGRFSFLQNDNSEVFTVMGSGAVGIGTPSPTNKFTVVGAQSADENILNVTNLIDQDFTVRLSTPGAPIKRTILATSTVNRLSLGVGTSNEHLTVINGGNVGIGTTSPSQKLTVNGTIYGKQVKVDLSVPGPDYVFEKSYSLPSLDQVKSYIDENKHLPEIPSAKEMEANGINVGEMNMLLLKKIEELTLYVIELKKENNDFKSRIEKIENKN